jgi:hypothetical protein
LWQAIELRFALGILQSLQACCQKEHAEHGYEGDRAHDVGPTTLLSLPFCDLLSIQGLQHKKDGSENKECADERNGTHHRGGEWWHNRLAPLKARLLLRPYLLFSEKRVVPFIWMTSFFCVGYLRHVLGYWISSFAVGIIVILQNPVSPTYV